MNDATLRIIRKAIAPIQRRIMLAVGRAVLKAIRDDKGMQEAKIGLLAGELRDRVERMQEYGFTSVPLEGCEAAVMFVGGDRGHGLIVATDDRRYRKKGLQPGEVALYTDEGDYILLKRGRIMEVVAGTKLDVTAPEVVVTASSKVTLDTPQTELTGALTVAGLITGQGGMAISGGAGASVEGDIQVTSGDVTADGISLKTHVHGGVSTGGGTTGAPQ